MTTTTTRPVFSGARMRKYRIQAGWNQRELAARLCINESKISSYERGLMVPSGPMVIRLAHELSVIAEDLYEGISTGRT